MATPLVGRGPACTSCLRRLARTATTTAIGGSSSPLGGLTQVRHKSKGRPVDQGVLVRLLEDIPKFGRKHTIFRTERGRMRNTWFPQKQAEYVTAARLAELGLTKDAIGARDPVFGTYVPSEAPEAAPAPEPARQKKGPVEGITPEHAHALLSTLLPETLTFARKLIHATPPAPRLHPLLAAHAAVSSAAAEQPDPASAAAEAGARRQQQHDALAIYGSVSANDVAALVRDRLLRSGDADAGRISLDGAHVRFLGLEDPAADRVKTLGRWEVDIVVGGSGAEVAPVRKVVEVVSEKEE